MLEKKRIFIIISLIIIGIFIALLLTLYEDKLILKEQKIKVENKYSPFKNTSNFKIENKERYVAFYENNKDLSYEKVVTYVNIGLDKEFYSYIKNTDPSKGILILVNKYQKLTSDYTPNDLEEINSKYFINGNSRVRMLRKEAKENFEKLSEASIKNNTPVYGQSAYRSYQSQETLYNNAVNTIGKEKADIDTARPGHSEHQTGLTIDVSSTKNGNMLEFGNTASYYWMIENAHKYGFILRYPQGKEKIHGFINEPWHYRYVGIETATDMHNNHSNLTFDEYYYKYIDNK